MDQSNFTRSEIEMLAQGCYAKTAQHERAADNTVSPPESRDWSRCEAQKYRVLHDKIKRAILLSPAE